MTQSANRFTNRADLLIAAGESIKMQTSAGIEPMCKLYGDISTIDGKVLDAPELYEFPLAVVEGNPVFVGDELYDPAGIKYVAGYAKEQEQIWAKPETPVLYGTSENGQLYFCQLENAKSFSWNPPKPAVVTVPLLREDAESLQDLIIAKDASQERVMNAIREALEK